MATIRKYPFLSHVTVEASRELLIARGGQVRSLGPGAALWFNPLGTSLVEVPREDLSFGSIVRVVTSDRQEVSVQMAFIVRLLDARVVSQRFDFAVDPTTGLWSGTPLQAVQTRLVERAQQLVAERIGEMPLSEVFAAGFVRLGEFLTQALVGAPDLAASGITVLEVGVLSLRADEEMERAFQVVTREAAQAEADRATYERRAQAVERERAIKENELANRTELARRQAELVQLEGANERRRTEQSVERGRLVAEAEQQALAARLQTFGAADRMAVLAAMLPEIAAVLPKVDSLTVTPDMLDGALRRLLEGARA
ncbi:MAG: SPFH domain-containing protein [Arachnia propionica]|uniref:SPFH domain-containing protein n=1 Tax=Arachnia propionica TaxID=1750 RepID=UPI0026F63ACB|nr:SPFH domain-containing protein [Arachnia propionica]